jgi:dTDP-4-dehydrorhamnose 3,5-epimerase
VPRELIKGVKVKQLRNIPDERGRLFEILRSDDKELFTKFGQAYVTTTYPGVVKAWHYHKLQDDYFTCLRGMIKLCIYDHRPDSPTYKMLNEFYIGEHNLQIIVVPRLTYHGWKCVSTEEAMILNLVTECYNYQTPDEHRIDPHKNDVIDYDWSRKDG